MVRFSVKRFFIKTTLLFLYFILIPLSSIAASNQAYNLEETFRILEVKSTKGSPWKYEEVDIFGGVVVRDTIRIVFDKNKIEDREIQINAWICKKGEEPPYGVPIEVAGYTNNKTRTVTDIENPVLGGKGEFARHIGDTLYITIKDLTYDKPVHASMHLKDFDLNFKKSYFLPMIFGYEVEEEEKKEEEKKKETIFATSLAIVWQPVTFRVRSGKWWKFLEIVGFSVHIAALNFSNKHSFEIGYGVGTTLLEGLLHLQYGYNPSAREGYYALGSDLLSLKKLFPGKK